VFVTLLVSTTFLELAWETKVVLGGAKWGKLSGGTWVLDVNDGSVTDSNNIRVVSSEVGVGVAESRLTGDGLEMVRDCLDWGFVGALNGDVVVGCSLTGVGDFSCDLSVDGPVFDGEFLAVEGLGVVSGAVVSDGLHGHSWGLLGTWLGNIKDLGDWVGSDGLDIDGLLLVDEDGAWPLLGGGGWVVDGLSAWNLLVDGLLSGDLNWDLDGSLFLGSVLLEGGGGDWNLDDFLNLFADDLWNLDGLFGSNNSGDWNLFGAGDLLDDGLLFLSGAGDLLGDDLFDLFDGFDLLDVGLWNLDGVVLDSGGWDFLGGDLWDLLGDNLVSVALVVAPGHPWLAFIRG